MKIVQIVSTFPPYRGGMGNSVYNFSKGLANLGYDITVLTPDYSSKNKKDNQSDIFDDSKLNFKVLRLKPLFKYGNAAFVPQLFWQLNNYNIVHLHYPFFGGAEIIVLLKLFFRKKIKLIVHYHMDVNANGFKGLIFKLNNLLILPILLRQVKIITCASIDYIKHSQIAGYYSKHAKKFHEILFGVDLKKFIVSTKKIQKKQKTILFVGGLDKAHYFKGLEYLLQAVKILKENPPYPPLSRGQIMKIPLTPFIKGVNNENPPNPLYQGGMLNLIIIGDGDLKDYYKNLAKKLEINEIVIFLSKIDNEKLVDYYSQSDVFVLPSINKSEAFGLTLLEAMSCGTPVIATNLPGVRCVFENNKQGFLVEPKDVNGLAVKLKIILTDENLAKQIGQAGRKLVEDKYTWEKVIEKLSLIYNE